MSLKQAPTLVGAESLHANSLFQALDGIAQLVAQELAEPDDDLDLLQVARAALLQWAAQEQSESGDDDGVVQSSAKPELTRKGMDRSYATFTVSTKALGSETGEIEAIANTLSVVDRQRDVMEKNCWSDVIQKMKAGTVSWPTLCWAHEWSQPVGRIDYAEERGDGLYIKGRFNLGTQRGRDAYSDVAFGAISQLSVGFLCDGSGEFYDQKGVRHVTKVSEWPEVSFVLIGASPGTRVMSLKSLTATADPLTESIARLVNRVGVEEAQDVVDGVIEEWKTDRVIGKSTPLSDEDRRAIHEMVELILAEQVAKKDSPQLTHQRNAFRH